MEYNQFSVEELASDESFIAWATGSVPESQRFWEEFVVLHPEMRVKVMQARALVLNLQKAQVRPIPDEQVEYIWEMIDTATVPARPVIKRRSFFRHYAVAATVGVVAVTAFALFSYLRLHKTDNHRLLSISDSKSEFVEEMNTSGNVLRIHLSDGSIVALENNSRLKYRTDYEGESSRAVYLTGEAFFEVERNPSQPFLVHSGEVVTRVLGTSFRVKAPEDKEQVVISVRTGRVSVYKAGGDGQETQKNAVIVLPNEQVTYQRDLDTFGRALVTQPEIVDGAVVPDDFNFENTAIRDVFGVLERAYQVDIIFDEELMSNCFFTAPLGSEHLFEKLKIICRAIGAEYEIIDAKIVVTGTGCKTMIP